MVDDEGTGPEATAIQRKRPTAGPTLDGPTPALERVTDPIERVTTPLDRVTTPIDRATSRVARAESSLPLPAPDPTIDSSTGEATPLPAPREEPTVEPTGATVRPKPSATSHGAGSTTIGSPLEALERDELLRTRRFCVIGACIALAGAFSVPLLPGDPTASALLLSCVGAGIA